ncbi:MAG: CvpA family protein [Desulfobacter sp.]
MNLFDIGVLAIVGFCLIRGGFRGLIREVSGIIGIVAGFYGANTYYLFLVPYVQPWISSPGAQRLSCFFFLFCMILIAVGLLARLIRKLLRLVFLGWVDRTFGVVFGAAKGVLIVTILFIMATTFVPGSNAFLSDSRTAPYLAGVADAMTMFVSRNIKTDFYRHLEEVKKEWKP